MTGLCPCWLRRSAGASGAEPSSGPGSKLQRCRPRRATGGGGGAGAPAAAAGAGGWKQPRPGDSPSAPLRPLPPALPAPSPQRPPPAPPRTLRLLGSRTCLDGMGRPCASNSMLSEPVWRKGRNLSLRVSMPMLGGPLSSAPAPVALLNTRDMALVGMETKDCGGGGWGGGVGGI
jgi:hypothetical protein